MKPRTPYLVCAVLVLLLSSPARAQTYKDAGLWAGYGVNLKYKKKWEFSASPEIRFDNNMTHLNRVMIDLGAEYKPLKTFFAAVSYRTSARSQDDWTDFRERIQFGIGIRQSWQSFTITYQPRYQASLQQITSDGDADFETTMRNKLTVKYDVNKQWNAATSFELFNSSEQGMNFRLENWRWIAYESYELNKRNSMSVGYMIQKSIYQSPQEMDFVVLVSYKSDINLSKKKKNKQPENTTPAVE